VRVTFGATVRRDRHELRAGGECTVPRRARLLGLLHRLVPLQRKPLAQLSQLLRPRSVEALRRIAGLTAAWYTAAPAGAGLHMAANPTAERAAVVVVLGLCDGSTIHVVHVHVSGHLKAAVVVVHASQFGFVAREAAVVGHRFEVSVEEAIEEAIDPVLHAALARALEQQKRREGPPMFGRTLEALSPPAPTRRRARNRWRPRRLVEPDDT